MPRELDPQKVHDFETGFYGPEEAERRRKMREQGQDPNQFHLENIVSPETAEQVRRFKNLFSK